MRVTVEIRAHARYALAWLRVMGWIGPVAERIVGPRRFRAFCADVAWRLMFVEIDGKRQRLRA